MLIMIGLGVNAQSYHIIGIKSNNTHGWANIKTNSPLDNNSVEVSNPDNNFMHIDINFNNYHDNIIAIVNTKNISNNVIYYKAYFVRNEDTSMINIAFYKEQLIIFTSNNRIQFKLKENEN